MESKMTEQEYISRFGILLEDVLISRKRALKKGKIKISNDYVSPKCWNTQIEELFATI